MNAESKIHEQWLAEYKSWERYPPAILVDMLGDNPFETALSIHMKNFVLPAFTLQHAESISDPFTCIEIGASVYPTLDETSKLLNSRAKSHSIHHFDPGYQHPFIQHVAASRYSDPKQIVESEFRALHFSSQPFPNIDLRSSHAIVAAHVLNYLDIQDISCMFEMATRFVYITDMRDRQGYLQYSDVHPHRLGSSKQLETLAHEHGFSIWNSFGGPYEHEPMAWIFEKT